MRFLLKLVALLFATLLLAGVALSLLLATEAGTRWLLQRTVAMAPAQISIGAVHGNALGPLTLDTVEYRDTTGTLRIQQLSLDWRPMALLYSTLKITVLKTQGLRWQPAPAKATVTPAIVLPEITLPLRIALEHVELQDSELILKDVRIPITQLQLSADLDANGLNITSLRLITPETQLLLSGRIQPHGAYNLESKLAWSPGSKATYPLHGSATVSGALNDLHLTLTQSQPFQLDIEATLRNALSATPHIDATGRWHKARWPLQDAEEISSPCGELHITGTPDDYTLKLDAEIKGTALTDGHWHGTGHGDSNAINWQPLQIDTLDGTLELAGKLAWAPTLHWDMQLNGRALNPGGQWPEWPGKLSFDIATTGSYKPGAALSGLDAELHINSFNGELRGYPLHARGALAFTAGTLRITDLALDSGSAHLAVAGTAGTDWQLDWTLDAPQLDNLLPQARGNLTGSGTLRGPRTKPRIAAQFNGGTLAYAAQTIGSLRAQLALDLADASASKIDVQLDTVRTGGRTLRRASFTAGGKLHNHKLSLQLVGADLNAQVEIDGGWDGKRWQGFLQQADVRDTAQHESRGDWRLSSPVRLRVTPPIGAATAAAELSEACWHEHTALVCLSASWNKADWKLDARLEHIALQLLSTWLPPDVQLKGALDGTLTAHGGGSRTPSAQLRLTPTPGALIYQNPQDETVQVAYEQATLQATLRDGNLTSSAQLRLSQQGTVRAELQITSLNFSKPLAQARLHGRIQGDFSELGLLAAFIPATEETRGQLNADLGIGGTLAQPRLTGQVILSKAGAFLPQLGMRLEDVTLTAQADGGPQLGITGQARSGAGHLQLQGALDLDTTRGFPTRLDITGENFVVLNLPDIQAKASPDLTLLLHDHSIQVTGTLVIPEASITVRKLPESAVALSDDVVIVGLPVAPTARWQIGAQIDLSLGDKVRFNGFNLESRITGKVHIEEQMNRPTQAQGELQLVDGKYNAYGRKLDITKGRLIFTGLLDNPQLDARAVRKVGSVTAGIRAVGALKEPNVSVYAEPAMDQGDALAYLLIGRPLNQASGAEGQMLQQASSSLGLSGGLFLARQIGQRLGLEDVQIETDQNSTDASLVVGKYLSPKLYISYGVGLFQPENLLRLRYQFNRWLTLQTENGTQSGADVLYTNEYD